MDQLKIGKFITKVRKEKKLTQEQLAELLGVTNRSVSNWETGKNMPDLALFKPLCEILNITINELLSGERLTKEEYQNKFEENILNTIDYSNKKINKYNHLLGLIILIFGLFISISAIMLFPSESSWGSIYSILGLIIFTLGIKKIMPKIKWYKKFIILILIFISALSLLIFTDYLSVKFNKRAPMFRTITTTTGDVIYYDTLFYDVYRCNFDKDNEYWVIKKNSKPSINELINFCK